MAVEVACDNNLGAVGAVRLLELIDDLLKIIYYV